MSCNISLSASFVVVSANSFPSVEIKEVIYRILGVVIPLRISSSNVILWDGVSLHSGYITCICCDACYSNIIKKSKENYELMYTMLRLVLTGNKISSYHEL